MELLQSCRKTAHKYYTDLLLAAEKSLLDHLFAQAEKASSNTEQRLYYEAMQRVRAQSDAMHQAFSEQLQTAFNDFSRGVVAAPSEGKTNRDELSLVNREELEDELAISVIVSKANNRNTEQLWKLNRRLAALRGGTPVEDEDNPFGPAQIGKALQRAVHTLQLDSKSRLIIYKHLGKLLVVSFSKVLDALNNQLVAKGILPNLRFSLAKSESAPEPEPHSESGSLSLGDEQGSDDSNLEPDTSQETASSIANQQQIFAAIRSLQQQTGPRTHTAGGVSFEGVDTSGKAGSDDTFAPMDYALALSAVQQSDDFINAAKANRAMSAEQVERRVLAQLKKQANPNAHHKIASQDADTVDLVGMIFRYILDDENLSDTVKSLLSHLHTPYLKLSLMDASFLENYQHSARVLINTMAEVGGRWVQDDDDRTVLPKLKSIVETVLQGFIDDVTLFDRLLEDFQRFKEGLDKRSRMVEKRNTESQQGLERLELSRQKAHDEIEQRLQSAAIPEVSCQILRKPWADFLAFNLLRHGDESLTWKSALKVVDGMIWSVEQGRQIDSREDFRRRQQSFDQTVQEGLAAIGYDVQASDVLLGCLKEAQELAYHEVMMSGAGDKTSPQQGKLQVDKTAAPVKVQAQPHGQQKKPAPADKPLTPKEQEIADALRDIAFGTWFEFSRGGEPQQLKLAWYSRVTSHYMFVNRAGIKQAVETHNDLARGMACGEIVMVAPEKRSFMERALGAVLSKLRLKAA